MKTLFLKISAALILAAAVAACGDGNSPSALTAPGEEKTPKTRALETGAALLQGKEPIGALNMYLDGFHFYNGRMDGQMEAHHYCGRLSEDFTQCAIYDGNDKQSRLMGVEYIVSEKVFRTLPEEEKKLWHSHVYEVKSGTLVAPGIPELAERELMEQIVSTYGKTWHTWHTEHGEAVPLGSPQLMMGFTADGQLKPELLKERDERLGISSHEKRQQRAAIPTPSIVPGADSWRTGPVVQLPHLAASRHDSGRAQR
jgi:hypothetical protein